MLRLARAAKQQLVSQALCPCRLPTRGRGGEARLASSAPRSASSSKARGSDRARAVLQKLQAQAQQAAEQAAELNLPPATHSRIKSARFIKSSVKLDQCPKPLLPEFAVIGRSNVGKSSLINMLTNKGGLAQVSKTPGKTRCINHFLINEDWYLVDLPGYGYASTGKASRLEWSDFTKDYFINRETLACVFVLVDASIPVQAADLECLAWLVDARVPFAIVFTKIDKRKKRCPRPEENMAAFEAEFRQQYQTLPTVLSTSAQHNVGRTELLTHMARLRNLNAAAPDTGGVEPDEWEGLAE